MTENSINAPLPGPAKRIVQAIEGLGNVLSIISALTLLLIAMIVCFEVGSRYLFNSPTIWAWDVNAQLMMVLVMLGLADVYRRDLNVRVDVIADRLSPRLQLILNIPVGLWVLFVAAIMLWAGWDYFESSWSRGQRVSSLFAPPIWPAKFMLPLGAGILTLQVLAKLAHDLVRAICWTSESTVSSSSPKDPES